MQNIYQLLNEMAETIPIGGDSCIDGELGGWAYHAHLVIGATEVQLYRASGNRDRGDAGDIMARLDNWGGEWEVTL